MTAKDQQAPTIEEGATVQVVSGNEKKAKKAIKAAGVKKVDGINRVVLRKRGGVSFVVEQPDVYRTPNGAYIVFGTARVQEQDLAQQLAALTGGEGEAGAAGSAAAGAVDKSPEAITADLEAAVKNTSIKDDEEVDEASLGDHGIDEGQITIVQEQANTTRAKAIKALLDNEGDVVNALMALTN